MKALAILLICGLMLFEAWRLFQLRDKVEHMPSSNFFLVAASPGPAGYIAVALGAGGEVTWVSPSPSPIQ